MSRLLVQIQPDYREQVSAKLREVGLHPIRSYFDYIEIEAPKELIPAIKKIPRVVDVRRDKPVGIMQYVPIPVDKKLARFKELARNPLTLPHALSFSLDADRGKKRWCTYDSRKLLGADKAEYEGYTGKGVKVAILDTGGDSTCSQRLGATGESSVEGQPLFWDENGHGVHCYTTICGSVFPTPWGTLKGVAPDAELGIFKVLGYGAGAGTETSVMRGMMDAFRWGVDIISMSLGSPYSEESADKIPESRAIRMLTEHGIIVVVANGNDGPEPRTVGVPANTPQALSVGAI
ncbi:MAG: S8 family serine peptidase, partial [Alphaproteobacteria bacterium]|nr:S8 family serine peptidase [Alphaproteobacteria bacterium]